MEFADRIMGGIEQGFGNTRALITSDIDTATEMTKMTTAFTKMSTVMSKLINVLEKIEIVEKTVDEKLPAPQQSQYPSTSQASPGTSFDEAWEKRRQEFNKSWNKGFNNFGKR